MKNGKGKRIALFGLAMLLALLMPVVCAAQGIDYETLRYDVDVVISEQNAYAVTETITVDFKSPAHGIYRYITTGGDLYYVDEQGNLKTANGKLHISNIDTGGVTLKKSYENDNVVLRLGDADITLTGEYTYTIRYIAEMYDDGTDAFDHVYWDLIPAEWQSPIREASFRVELPKDFDDSTLEWISGPTGSGTTGEVEWTRSGNAVSGTLLRPLDAYEGVTVRIVLPDGYFTGVRSDTWMGIAGGFASLISALIALLLFKRYGKDRKIVPVVEFYPPDDLSPAEVGYILNGKADVKDILSLVPYLAHKGYMDIRRLEPKKTADRQGCRTV